MRLRSFRKMSSGLFIAAMLLNVFNCNPIFVHALAEENVHTNTNETAAPEAEEGGESDSEQTEIGDGTEGDSTDEEQTEIDDVESENTEETVAPEQTEEIGDLLDQAIVAQLPPQPIEIESAGVDALPTESGVYLYNLIQDSAQIFNLTFPDTIFKNNSDKGDITVTITLPKYGMAFTDNMVHDLSSAPQIKSAGFIKNSSGYNTGLTFVIDSHINKQYLTAFSTQYVPLSQKQCADIIANGWEESPVEIVVKNGAGEVVSTNTKYTMKPGKYIEPDINIPAHNNTTTSIAAHANKSAHGNTFGNYSLGGGQDNLYLDVPTVSHNNADLLQIEEIKFYVPDERFELVNVVSTPVTAPMYSGTQAPADYQFMTYFSTDKVRHHDSNGSYYVFKPKAPFYNNGDKTHLGQTIYGSRVLWKITDDLESETTYTAADTEIVAKKAGGGTVSILHTGSVVKTLKTVLKDTFVWRPYGNYLLNAGTTNAKYIPGATYYKTPFVQMLNSDSFNQATMTEYKTINGNVVEEYDFPYEIRPTAWKPYIHGANYNGNKATVHAITYTVTKADGTTQDYTEVIDQSITSDYAVSLDFSSHLNSGDRVSKVKIDWSEMHSIYYTCSGFDYTVTTTHADHTPIVNGDLLHVGYSSSTAENGKSFAGTVPNANRYIYLSYGEPLCPWLNAYGSSYQMYKPKMLDDSEVVLVPELFLKVNSSLGKNYSDNPVIDLKIKLNHVTDGVGGPEISDGTFMLSGNMTMTKNMSGWKFEYTVIDKVTKATRTASYQVGTLTGDTPLTRAMLGLADSEAFLNLSMRYDGKFVFKDTITDEQKVGHADNSSPGFYDLTYLLKDIKAYTTAKSLQDNDLITYTKASRDGSTMYFDAVYTHQDSCPNNKKNFFYGASVWNYPAYILISSRSYTVDGPGFSANVQPAVIQGNSFTATINFDLKAYANTGYMNDTYQKMPYDVPEQVFIELADPDFTIDKNNAAFKQSLQDHGMTEADVEEVVIGGKKWIKLNIKKAGDKIKSLNANSTSLGHATVLKNKFVIALNAWEGATLGNHHPFKDVYFNNSALLEKYDGSKNGGYVKEEFTNAVEDPYDLLGDGDNTTKRLWYGDMSSYTVEVLRNAVLGINLYPVKDDVVYKKHTVEFVEEEREQLAASIQMKMADKDAYHYTVITKIPAAGEEIDYDYIDTDNSVKTGRKKSDFTMYLNGPAQIDKSSLNHGVVQFTYSKDGLTFVPESSIAPADFKEYRYVKTYIDVFEKYEALHVKIPLAGELKTDLKERKAYVGGTYSYDSSSAAPTTTVSGNLMYGEYVYKNYSLDGKLFWDKNENGVNDAEEPAKEITLQLFSPDHAIQDAYGNVIAAHTLLDTVKTDSGGLFHFSSPIGLENQKIVLAVDENTKPTKQETGAEIWDSIDDSDFDRETKSLILPKLNKEKNENCSGGLIHLPTLTVENIVMHVKDTHALHTVSKSENPANLNPAVTYTVTSGNADLSILTSTDITGEKIGVQKIKASISNTLGDVVAKEFEVKIYANIIYHANGNTGDVPIDNTQYTSDMDTVVVKDNLSLSKPGYVFYGWSKNKDAVVPEYFPHTVFTFGETEKDVVLYAIFRPIVIKPEKPPVSLRPAPLVPDTSDQTHIWKYVFWLILSIGTAFTANRYRTKRHSE